MIIPLNIRDGSIIAKGRGNEAWNNVAPHGAGREMSRGDAKEKLSLGAYKADIEGIYSTSVCNRPSTKRRLPTNPSRTS